MNNRQPILFPSGKLVRLAGVENIVFETDATNLCMWTRITTIEGVTRSFHSPSIEDAEFLALKICELIDSVAFKNTI